MTLLIATRTLPVLPSPYSKAYAPPENTGTATTAPSHNRDKTSVFATVVAPA